MSDIRFDGRLTLVTRGRVSCQMIGVMPPNPPTRQYVTATADARGVDFDWI